MYPNGTYSVPSFQKLASERKWPKIGVLSCGHGCHAMAWGLDDDADILVHYRRDPSSQHYLITPSSRKRSKMVGGEDKD